MTNDIVLFETRDKSISLPVQVTDDTVWLTQTQMTELFSTTKQNISLHINNCFKEKELDKNSVVKDFLTTASDGKSYRTNYYNLDVIISVGYRVKSQRGVEFRRWANGVLKQYILNGVAVNNKCSYHSFGCRIRTGRKEYNDFFDNEHDKNGLRF